MNTTESRREFEEQAEKFGYILSNMPSKMMIDFAFDMWQAARERQWRRIETAPDITEILVFSDSFNTIWIATRLDGKWIDASDGKSINRPKFWMPLPNPPASEKI